MKKWLTALLMALLTMTVSVQTVMAADKTMSFDEFFEQSVFFPTDYAGKLYASGTWRDFSGEPVETKEGVLYVTPQMLAYVLGDTEYHLMDRGNDVKGQVTFVPSQLGQKAWGYSEGNPTAFCAWLGQTRCTVYDKEKTLRHAPYLFEPAGGGPKHVMLPLQEICQLLGRSYTTVDGLVIISRQTVEAKWLSQQKDTLSSIKSQLSQPSISRDSCSLSTDNGGNVIISGGYSAFAAKPWSQIANYEHPNVICQVQNEQGQASSAWYDTTEEATVNIVLKDKISGQEQLIATLPNVPVDENQQEKMLYHQYKPVQYLEVPNGYVITASIGGTAQNYSEQLFFCTNDGQVIKLKNRESASYGDYCVTEQALYYTTAYREAMVGGQSGYLYRYNWHEAAPEQIGQKKMDYRQIAYVGDGVLIAAASPYSKPENVQLYQLNTATGEQQLLHDSVLTTLTAYDGDYFQVSGQAICYRTADQTLYTYALDSGKRRPITAPLARENWQRVADGFCFVGVDNHLYYWPAKAQTVTDISGCIIEEYVNDSERVFYHTANYRAGVYLWEKGQTKQILNQRVEDMALDSYGALIILPYTTDNAYYVYDQGELGKMRL